MSSRAQEAPFEPEPPSVRGRIVLAPEVSGFDPLGAIGLPAIRAYQRDMRNKSISRCPFRVSCSNYAIQAMEKHGFLVGLAYLLDRFFFRENEEALQHYPSVIMPDGTMKLDDGVAENFQ